MAHPVLVFFLTIAHGEVSLESRAIEVGNGDYVDALRHALDAAPGALVTRALLTAGIKAYENNLAEEGEVLAEIRSDLERRAALLLVDRLTSVVADQRLHENGEVTNAEGRRMTVTDILIAASTAIAGMMPSPGDDEPPF